MINYSLEAILESCTDVSDAVYELWDAIEAGSTFTDAYSLYETDLEDATTTCAEYVVESDIDLEAIVESLEAAASTTDTETTETTADTTETTA